MQKKILSVPISRNDFSKWFASFAWKRYIRKSHPAPTSPCERVGDPVESLPPLLCERWSTDAPLYSRLKSHSITVPSHRTRDLSGAARRLTRSSKMFSSLSPASQRWLISSFHFIYFPPHRHTRLLRAWPFALCVRSLQLAHSFAVAVCAFLLFEARSSRNAAIPLPVGERPRKLYFNAEIWFDLPAQTFKRAAVLSSCQFFKAWLTGKHCLAVRCDIL